MMDSFGSFCDDLFIDMSVSTQLDLPSGRDTILTFFERLQKQYPQMNSFSRRQTGEYILEQEQDGARLRWVALEPDRIVAGCADPKNTNEAYELHHHVLSLMPYMLGVSPLDIDSMDITFTMDFDYQGNQDEVIADALLSHSSFAGLLDMPGAKPVSCCPTVIVALSEDLRLQARIGVESRTSALEMRGDKYKTDEPISLYFTVRRYPMPGPDFDTQQAYQEQCRIAETMMVEKVIPGFVQPLNNAIAQRR